MVTISARTIETAKPKPNKYDITVDAGLYIRVYPTGLKRWVARFVVNGKQRFATLPKPYGTTGNGDMSLALPKPD